MVLAREARHKNIVQRWYSSSRDVTSAGMMMPAATIPAASAVRGHNWLATAAACNPFAVC